ncbi:Hsp70 family protein [Dermabacteraceae bacterium TAE3-ERU27]|nr:Hsp70 family protein [Dermabacteraceae bacterium TAE3-ERU27]
MSKIIGIDLGTTNCAVAVIKESGKPEIIKNQEGDPTTPSVVLFQDFGEGVDEPLVGTLAKRQAALYPDDIVQYVKRRMGDPDWRFDSTAGNEYTAEEVSAIILKRLKQDAEMALGEEVTDAVITVPAYFDDARRTATKQAGKIAGLNVLRVLNEPTAAALSYGVNSEVSGTVLVYDLGGGTFDVTLLKINDSNFEVIATDGDRNLGGFDFDNELMTFVAEQLEAQGAKDVLDDTAVVADLREKAEIAKKSLTTMASTKVQTSVNGKPYKVTVTREDFEKCTASLLERTKELVESVLAESKTSWSGVDHVLLVGGSTRMPMVKAMVEDLSGKGVELDVNPDEAVAQGAAVQGALSGGPETASSGNFLVGDGGGVLNGKTFTIADVTSQSLGVILVDSDSNRDTNVVVIERNSKIPGSHSVPAFTLFDRQTGINVKVTEGEDTDPEFVTIIGESTLSIPPYPKGAPIEITYSYDIDQTIVVEVFDHTAGKSLGTFDIDRVANMDESSVGAAAVRLQSMEIS